MVKRKPSEQEKFNAIQMLIINELTLKAKREVFDDIERIGVWNDCDDISHLKLYEDDLNKLVRKHLGSDE